MFILLQSIFRLLQLLNIRLQILFNRIYWYMLIYIRICGLLIKFSPNCNDFFFQKWREKKEVVFFRNSKLEGYYLGSVCTIFGCDFWIKLLFKYIVLSMTLKANKLFYK